MCVSEIGYSKETEIFRLRFSFANASEPVNGQDRVLCTGYIDQAVKLQLWSDCSKNA